MIILVVEDEPIVAINPGTFDPVTLGHVDVVRRAAAIFDSVVVGVVRDPTHKQTLFTVEERVAFLEDAVEDHRHHPVADLPIDRLTVVPLLDHDWFPTPEDRTEAADPRRGKTPRPPNHTRTGMTTPRNSIRTI